MVIKLRTWSCLEIRIQDELSVRNDNSTFERVEEFKYLGTTLANKKILLRKKLIAD